MAARLPDEWRGWIMKCVTGASMNILWNGERTEAFTPSRGLRQGDPLSPYLFVLCIERLCHMIDSSINAKEWKPICLSRGGPQLSHICFADDLILFAEASVKQIRIIRRVLETFCATSGQKVSLEKSKIFFSSNVSRDLEKLISDESGIKATKDLGKYLGMPVLQKRVSKETFGDILEKVSSRLAGWKSHVLSTAGRLTLTKAVLGSIPVHSMTTFLLPKSTLDKLDKISRNFVWGSTPENRKQHLIAWKSVCLPKCEGGLGIRRPVDMNKALLAKAGWRLLHEYESLWAAILRKKYKVGEIHDLSWTVVKSGWSSTWKSLGVGIREVVIPGLGWVLGDGRSARFWTDKWLGDFTLMEMAPTDIPTHLLEKRTRDYWRNGIGWDFVSIMPYVSDRIRLHLLAVVLDTITGTHDRLSWRASQDGKFSVKSAYLFLTKDNLLRPSMGHFYERIWRVKVPERVRFFLWLVVNRVIMTNMERQRRHLCDSGLCSVCRSGDETIMHVLRDCPAMEGLWIRLVPVRKRRLFFHNRCLSGCLQIWVQVER